MKFLKWLFSASGRSCRAAYLSTVIFFLSVWNVAVAVMIPMCAFLFIPGVLEIYGIAKPGEMATKATVIVCLMICVLCIYSILCATARRLHDTGRRGIYALFLIIPVIGLLIILPALAKKTQDVSNKHGEPRDKRSFIGTMGGLVVGMTAVLLVVSFILLTTVYANANGRVKSYTGVDIPGYVTLYKDKAAGLATKSDRDWKEWVDERQESYLSDKIPTESDLSKAIFGKEYGLDPDRDALTDEVMDVIIVYVTEGTGNTITKEIIAYDSLSIRRRAAYLIASCLYDGTMISEEDIEQSATGQSIGEAVDYVGMINGK